MSDVPLTRHPAIIGPGQQADQPLGNLQELLARAEHCNPFELAALACYDQRQRWQGGQRVPAEVYLKHLPSLCENPEVVTDLIYSEFLLRQELGEAPRLQEYLDRFPIWADTLRSHFECSQAPPALKSEAAPTPADEVSAMQDSAVPSTRLSLSPSPADCAPTPVTRVSASPVSLPSDVSAGVVIPDYELLGELGRGGMGVVYRARHIPTGEVVALKTLQRLTPAALYRFKQEFRVVAGLVHPNLISLRELVSDGAIWFFTMELLEGLNFRTYVRGVPAPTPQPENTETAPHPLGSLAQLREVLSQLADGVSALHAAGVLHRDIKPGNVLVTTSGRVVLLDFGLAGELTPHGLYHSSPGQVAGTVAYMAPEQAAGEALSSAADWYAFGVVLYELLAGRLPFTGTVHEVLRNKQRSDPPPPSRFCAGVPADLEQMCLGLLHRDPTRRLGGKEIHRRLGVTSGGKAQSRPDRLASGLQLFGRDDHLQALAAGFAAVRRGVAVCARVHGPSGSGKSALARSFLDRLSENGVVALAGRCYEQELVPYKAFDGVVDALSRYLDGLPKAEAATLLPRDSRALARLFPVLGQVQAIAAAPPGRGEVPDPREARRRGLEALRELLARLGDRHPLVVFVDDVQWGDADSAVLLEELLRPPDPPALLVLLCYRSEDAANSPTLQAVGRIVSAPPALEVIDVSVGPLSAGDARALAEHLLGGANDPAGRLADVVAQEAGGNPFYVGELAEGARAGLSVAGAESLDRLLWERSRGLPPDARRLLEVVAVAGRPVRQNIARQAAGAGVDFHAAQAALRAGRLLRRTGPAGEDLVAPYHDRVREAVLAYLPAEDRRKYHLGLARAMEGEGERDAEFLAIHFHGAGDGEAAGRYYAAAGAAAAAATAFDQAARLYHLAVEVGTWEAAEAARLRAGEADALANAGRGTAAAEAYLSAASLGGGDNTGEWRRRAAEQYLITGHIDVGLGVYREVVASVGMTFPRNLIRAVVGLLARRIWLRWRGTRTLFRPAAVVPADDLQVIDVCWSAATGLTVTDYIRGAYFQIRGLLRALMAGEPSRVARALALEGAHTAVVGPSADARSLRLITAAEAAAERSGDPYAHAMVALAQGMREYLAGRFRNAKGYLVEAEQTFRDACTGVTWELDSARVWRLWCLCYMGELSELASDWLPLYHDAVDRGDLYAWVNLGTWISAHARVAADDPGSAWRELLSVMARWSQQGFHVQHHNELTARVVLHLYEGKGEAAWQYIRGKEALYRRARLWQVQQVRIDFLQSRARSALAAAVQAADPRPLLRSAERDARTLERESAAWAQALGALLRACVHDAQAGSSSPDLFAAAAARLEAADLGVFAAAARYRQGEQTGGGEGRQLQDAAVEWLTGQGVRNPRRMICSHAPTLRSSRDWE